MGPLASMMLLAATSGAPTAHAQQAGELAYQWPEGETLHYRVQAYVFAPRVMRFYSQENLDARVAEFTMGILMKCVPGPLQGKYRAMDCDVHRAQLGGAAADPSEQQKLLNIFVEYVDLLDDATVEIEMRENGRFRTVDIEGIEKGTAREANVHETLRLIVSRALATMEVEMPKGGQDPGKPWRQKGSPLIMRLPTIYGTSGAVRLLHEVVDNQGDTITLQMAGQATVTPGAGSSSTDEATGASSSANQQVALYAHGSAVFDRSRGLVVKSESAVQGSLTASSSGVGSGVYLNQVLMMDLLPNFDQLDAEYEAMLEARASGNLPPPPKTEKQKMMEGLFQEALEKATPTEGAPAEGAPAEGAPAEGAAPGADEEPPPAPGG